MTFSYWYPNGLRAGNTPPGRRAVDVLSPGGSGLLTLNIYEPYPYDRVQFQLKSPVDDKAEVDAKTSAYKRNQKRQKQAAAVAKLIERLKRD